MGTEDQAKFAIVDGVASVVEDATTGAQVKLPPVTRIIPVNFDIVEKQFVVPKEMKDKYSVGEGGVVHWVAPYPITVIFDVDPPDLSKPSEKQFESKEIAADLHLVSVTASGHGSGKELNYTIFLTLPPGVKVPVDPSIIIDTTYNRFRIRATP